jgi:hypothetical protein
MRFESLAEVTSQHLTEAADQLRAAENSSELLNYLVELPLWTGYLKKANSMPLDRLTKPFDERMQAVFDQGETLGDADYREQMNVILQARAQVESTEIRRQTEEALKPGALTACPLPLL